MSGAETPHMGVSIKGNNNNFLLQKKTNHWIKFGCKFGS